MALFIAAVIVFIIIDLLIRYVSRQIEVKKQLTERKEALKESIKLNFTYESPTLKRAEVKSPKARILCVDDEPVILDSFRKILVLDGYSVDTVETGKEAIGLIQKHSYDFVFTDLKMPGMDGVEVTKQVKHIRPDIDVIIITGYATVQTAVECMKLGAMDYVEKPFSEEELLEFTKKLLLKRKEKIKRTIEPKVYISRVENFTGLKAIGFSIPGGVFISKNHCWFSLQEDGNVRAGIDDFAKKLIGKIDAVELPNVGMEADRNSVLFSVRRGEKIIGFNSPFKCKVIKINRTINLNPEELDYSVYGNNWFCLLEVENIEEEIKKLKIGQGAVDFYYEELNKLESLHKKLKKGGEVIEKFDYVSLGEMMKDNGIWWKDYAGAFFTL